MILCCRHADAAAQLHLKERRPLSDICYIEIGLSHQNIRIEFDKSGYCILLRDSQVGQLLHSSIASKFLTLYTTFV